MTASRISRRMVERARRANNFGNACLGRLTPRRGRVAGCACERASRRVGRHKENPKISVGTGAESVTNKDLA